jgi:hypothetical protein
MGQRALVVTEQQHARVGGQSEHIERLSTQGKSRVTQGRAEGLALLFERDIRSVGHRATAALTIDSRYATA